MSRTPSAAASLIAFLDSVVTFKYINAAAAKALLHLMESSVKALNVPLTVLIV